jgi:hypothetical protein
MRSKKFEHLDPTRKVIPTTINTYWYAHDDTHKYVGQVLVSSGYIIDTEVCMPQWLVGQHIEQLEHDLSWLFDDPHLYHRKL